MILFVSGCYSPAREPIRMTDCIPPITNFSFEVRIRSYNYDLLPPDLILPKEPWEFVSVVPLATPIDKWGINDIVFARNVGGHTKIWYMDYLDKTGEISYNHFTMRIYDVFSDIWKSIPIQLESPEEKIVQIYLDNSNIIWARISPDIGPGIDVSGTYFEDYTKSPFIFAKFNEDKGKFEYLDFSTDIPLGPVSFDGNKFWIFKEQGPLFRLDPKRLEIKEYGDYRDSPIIDSINHSLDIDIVRSDNALAFDTNGNFYFVDQTPKEEHLLADMNLFRFTPSTEKFDALYIPLSNNPLLVFPFVDKKGNVWLSDYGWMDANGVWHEIIRSPVFIADSEKGGSAQWIFPSIKLNSADGRMWFGSQNGMVSLDTEKGEWCWFTTYQSNIVEDLNGNLWMIANGTLYQYPAKDRD